MSIFRKPPSAGQTHLREQNETGDLAGEEAGQGSDAGVASATDGSLDGPLPTITIERKYRKRFYSKRPYTTIQSTATEATSKDPTTAENDYVGTPNSQESTNADINLDLINAICKSDLAAVKWSIARGASLIHRHELKDRANALILAVAVMRRLHAFTGYVSPPQANAIEIAKTLVAAAARAANKNDILNCRDRFGYTALYWAIQGPVLEIVEALVKAGASLGNINENGESALHVAAGQRLRYPTNLKYILDNMVQLNIKNSASSEKGSRIFPIHCAAKSGSVESMKLLLEAFGDNQLTLRNHWDDTALHIVAFWNSTEVAQYLLTKPKHHIIMNSVNKCGETPLYISASRNRVALITLFLRNGASLSVEGEKESAVNHIASNFADPLTYFENLFDHCIHENWNRLFINYTMLTERKGLSQIKVIEQLEECCGSKILKHPMIESLIYMKWKCLLPVFYIIIATYMPFLLVFNVFIITTFSRIDSNCEQVGINATEGEVPREGSACEGCDSLDWMMIAYIYWSIGGLFVQECIWLYLRALRYFMLPESWLRLCVLALASLVAAAGCAARAPASWQRHAACAALLLGWLHALFLLARFSGWGYYAFERAAINIVKILSMSLCFVLCFATCFMVHYQSNPPFDGPIAAFLKTLVMMSSEFDYEDLFDDKHNKELKDTKAAVRLLLVLFVIFIAVVLMNYMTGVAVSDIKELHDMGNLRRLTKQVELLSTLDSLGETVLGKRWNIPNILPRLKFLAPIYSELGESGRKWKIQQSQRQENGDEKVELTFDSEMYDAIYNIAKKKRNKLDELCDVVVGLPNTVEWKKTFPVTMSLKDRIELIENYCKETINSNKEIKQIETTNKEIKQSINDFRKDMERILETIICGVNSDEKPNKLVSFKSGLEPKIGEKKQQNGSSFK